MTAAITFDELEWRSYSILATATQTIVRVSRKSQVALFHYQILSGLNSISGDMRNLVDLFHADAARAFEASTPEQVSSLIETIQHVHGRVELTISRIRATNLGYWAPLYRSKLQRLETLNSELGAHAHALSNSDAALILLGKNGQAQLLESLLNPPEPNDALRRAFTRKLHA